MAVGGGDPLATVDHRLHDACLVIPAGAVGMRREDDTKDLLRPNPHRAGRGDRHALRRGADGCPLVLHRRPEAGVAGDLGQRLIVDHGRRGAAAACRRAATELARDVGAERGAAGHCQAGDSERDDRHQPSAAGTQRRHGTCRQIDDIALHDLAPFNHASSCGFGLKPSITAPSERTMTGVPLSPWALANASFSSSPLVSHFGPVRISLQLSRPYSIECRPHTVCLAY
jgi:hypothetical protein